MAISFVSSYSQNFDTLANSGTTNTLAIEGWALTESGGGARDNEQYGADTGGSNTGDTYSYGSAASTERALGGLQSGTLVPLFGAEFVNASGGLIEALSVAYTGEQWRVGTINRSDRLDFQISFDATSLTTGIWTSVDALDFNAPQSAVTGAKDGNAAANRVEVSSTITGLSIADGATFWIRWVDFNASGADDGLAVDDFSLSLGPATPLVTIAATDADAGEAGANPGTFRISRSGSTAAELVVGYTLSGNAGAGDYTPALSGSATIAVGQSFVDITITPVDDGDAEGNETVTLTLADGAGYGLGAATVATVTIADDDQPPTLISAIQGAGATSPLVGQVVTVEAVVVGDFQGSAGLSGFYLQEEAADDDANALTSEGLFVFQGAGGTAVNLGDKVRVTGTVVEFGAAGASLTELSNLSSVVVVGSGHALPVPVEVGFPLASPNTLEAYEGMRVTVTTTLTVNHTETLGRFGEVMLASDGASNVPGTDDRIDQYTQFHAPSVAGNGAYQLELATRQLILDDASGQQNRDPIAYGRGGQPLSAANTLRGGDTVSGLAGILDDRFRGDALDPYRLQPTAAVSFDAVNAREPAPDLGGLLTVASLNVLNYFNGDGAGGGFPTSRGATTLQEFIRQRDKVIAAIIGTGADVVGLLEIENDGYGAASAIADLVAGLNAATAPGTYAFIDPGVGQLGTDLITNGLIYKPAAVTPVGTAAILDASVDPRFNSGQQRPSLAQSFEDNATGALFTPVINHLKSKGSSAGGPGDADSGDGQGLSNGTRTRAAEALVDWLATLAADATRQGDADFLILGDLNAYALEDPLRAIEAGADDAAGTGDDYTNLIAAASYSYVFEGHWGALDHALGSAGLLAQVTGAAKWHINADEPTVLDYNTENKSAGQLVSLYSPDPYRASDHDAVIVGLALGNAVVGGARGEAVSGTAGNDRITAGGGRDLVVGLGGADVFVFTSLLDAYDVLADFVPGQDRLDIAALLASVGYGGGDAVADGLFDTFVPAPPLLAIGAAAAPPHTIVLFDADGAAGPGAPRPLAELVGVAVDDPYLLLGLQGGGQ